MAMNLKFDQGETEYEVVPKGEHKAICYRVVDAGTAEEEYQGEKSNKHKIFLFWELPELKMQDGRPMSIFAQYTASLNEKSNLYKASMAWMNRGFTAEEKQGFDPSMFLGKGCKLAVDHTVNGRAKVTAVLTAPSAFDENEQLKNLPTTNEQSVFDLEEYCKEFSGQSDASSKRACDIFDDFIMTCMKQALNAARSRNGMIDEGNLIYVFDLGINAAQAQAEVYAYLQWENEIIKEGKAPEHHHTVQWLEACAEKWAHCPAAFANSRGFDIFDPTSLTNTPQLEDNSDAAPEATVPTGDK